MLASYLLCMVSKSTLPALRFFVVGVADRVFGIQCERFEMIYCRRKFEYGDAA